MSNRAFYGPFVAHKRYPRASLYLYENRLRITLSEKEVAEFDPFLDLVPFLAQAIRQLAMRALLAGKHGEVVRPRLNGARGRSVRVNVNLSGQQLNLLEEHMQRAGVASHAAAVRTLALGAIDYVEANGIVPRADLMADPTRETLNPEALMVT